MWRLFSGVFERGSSKRGVCCFSIVVINLFLGDETPSSVLPDILSQIQRLNVYSIYKDI